MFVAALHVLLDGAALAAGVAAARRSLKFATLLGFIALGIVLAKCAIAYAPALEANLFPWDFYPYIERWWFYPFTFFLLGIGIYAARKSMWRRDLLLVLAGFLVLRVGDLVLSDALPRKPLQGQVDQYGFCPQTSDYSCGAAASVMLLYRYGIRATEEEMAQLCVTRSGLGGTTEAGILRGLRRKGLEVRAFAPEMPPAPSLVPVKINVLVSHWVLVREYVGDEVRISDPMLGNYRIKQSDFMRRWRRSAIEVTGP